MLHAYGGVATVLHALAHSMMKVVQPISEGYV
jgi:hypothetical protein